MQYSLGSRGCPDGHLYYVDNGRDQVVRIDPYFDMDADGVMDDDDNCPFIANADQANYDGDNFGDACDDDDDNDTVLDEDDNCPTGAKGWNSVLALDYDLDGCMMLPKIQMTTMMVSSTSMIFVRLVRKIGGQELPTTMMVTVAVMKPRI